MKLSIITTAALLAFSVNAQNPVPTEQCAADDKDGCVAIPEAMCFDPNMWFDCNWDGIIMQCMFQKEDLNCVAMMDWWENDNTSLLLQRQVELLAAKEVTQPVVRLALKKAKKETSSNWISAAYGVGLFSAGAALAYGVMKH